MDDVFFQKNILIVDDQAIVRAIMVEILRDFGFTNIYEAFHTSVAIAMLKQQNFDLIITDLRRETKIDGVTFSKFLSDTYPNTPRMLCTAHKFSQKEQEELLGIYVAMYEKPISYPTFGQVVVHALQQAEREK